MNLLDGFIVVSAVSAATAAFRIGFVARATSWIGLAIGLLIGARLLPWVLEQLTGTDEIRLLMVAFGVLVGSGMIGQSIGLIVGGRLRVGIPPGPARQVDRAAGALAGLFGVVVALWLMLPTMTSVPGWPAEQARNSTLAQAIDNVFGDPPDTFQTLRNIIGEDRFPEVFDSFQAAPDLGSPPAATGIGPQQSNRIAASTARIEGLACGRIQNGSGFVVADGLLVTNAHVVAGNEQTEVQFPGGGTSSATVVAFDPDRDLAILSAPGVGRPALPVGDSRVGEVGGVYGYPGGGDLRIAPFEVAREVTANGTDIYDQGPSRREVLFLSAGLQPGDSGSAVVNQEGEVVGVAFAIAPDRSNVAYALTDDELRAVLDRNLSQPVSTGPCIG